MSHIGFYIEISHTYKKKSLFHTLSQTHSSVGEAFIIYFISSSSVNKHKLAHWPKVKARGRSYDPSCAMIPFSSMLIHWVNYIAHTKCKISLRLPLFFFFLMYLFLNFIWIQVKWNNGRNLSGTKFQNKCKQIYDQRALTCRGNHSE